MLHKHTGRHLIDPEAVLVEVGGAEGVATLRRIILEVWTRMGLAVGTELLARAVDGIDGGPGAGPRAGGGGAVRMLMDDVLGLQERLKGGAAEGESSIVSAMDGVEGDQTRVVLNGMLDVQSTDRWSVRDLLRSGYLQAT